MFIPSLSNSEHSLSYTSFFPCIGNIDQIKALEYWKESETILECSGSKTYQRITGKIVKILTQISSFNQKVDGIEKVVFKHFCEYLMMKNEESFLERIPFAEIKNITIKANQEPLNILKLKSLCKSTIIKNNLDISSLPDDLRGPIAHQRHQLQLIYELKNCSINFKHPSLILLNDYNIEPDYQKFVELLERGLDKHELKWEHLRKTECLLGLKYLKENRINDALKIYTSVSQARINTFHTLYLRLALLVKGISSSNEKDLHFHFQEGTEDRFFEINYKLKFACTDEINEFKALLNTYKSRKRKRSED